MTLLEEELERSEERLKLATEKMEEVRAVLVVFGKIVYDNYCRLTGLPALLIFNHILN